MEGAAQSLVSNVGQLVGKEFRQLRGVGGEVARLRSELATINALLRMQSEADEGAVNHFVREWMKQLREVGYDAEDCIHLYLFRVRCRPDDHLLVWTKRLLTTLWSRRRLAGDIRDLRALASAINEQHARYGVSLLDSLLGHHAAASAVDSAPVWAQQQLRPAPADNNDDDPSSLLVGNKEAINDLANKVKALNHDDDNDRQLKVFSIVGFGGLGKTTLAVEVCRLLKTDFPRQAQVSVSQTFGGKDLHGLLRRLLRQITQPKQTAVTLQQTDPLGNIDTMDVGDLESNLKKRLDNNRYLILIDDVWSTAAWDMIRSKLPSSNCGSRIIVTTRIDTVAKACSTDANDYYIHRMKTLREEDSKQLFISKAFDSAGNPCPKEDKDLEDAMTSILKKCGGLPLAIVSIASLLASYKLPEGKKMWETVQKSTGSQMETNPTLEGMRQILTLSYNHLPHHLKACMMYLSIFPDDYIICKDRLLRRWIAEGLIAEKRGLTQMELAEGYFNELMSRSMIDWADGREDRCRVHDMMLEILVSKSLEANFVSLAGGQYEGMSYTDTIRRLSIHGGVEAHKKGSKDMAARRGTGSGGIKIKGMAVQHVRSLSIFDPEVNNNKLLARLAEFTLLRVLDLEGCKGLEEKHMSCICRMYLLRFLSLKGTDIKVVPPRVGDLERLQTLDVRETDLKDLPETVKKLENLEHLLFSNKGASSYVWSAWVLTRGIKRMKALCKVNRAVIYDPKAAEEIGELEQLQELAIYVDTRTYDLKDFYVDTRTNNDLMDVTKNLASSVSKMCSLRWLEIGNFGCGKWPFIPIMQFLHSVEPPPRLLCYLKIWGHMEPLPAWVSSLTDLVEVDIAWTYLHGDQLFNVLCKLPNLKRLSLGAYFIRHEQDMVFWGEGQQHMVATGSKPYFPVLKELTLGYSPEVPPAYVFKKGSMPKLEKLVVNFGDQEKRIVGINHLRNLKELQYNGVRENMEHAVEQLEELSGYERLTVRVRYDDELA